MCFKPILASFPVQSWVKTRLQVRVFLVYVAEIFFFLIFNFTQLHLWEGHKIRLLEFLVAESLFVTHDLRLDIGGGVAIARKPGLLLRLTILAFLLFYVDIHILTDLF